MTSNRTRGKAKCPVCNDHPELEVSGGNLVCLKCNRDFGLDHNLPNLLHEGYSSGSVSIIDDPETEPELDGLESDEIRVLIIHGPNLNLLGQREPEIYGHKTLQDINEMLKCEAVSLGCRLSIVQSNHEGDIITAIQSAMCDYEAIVINPGAYTHYSIAIYDALAAINKPKVEVHLSNIYGREEFRKASVTAGAVNGIVSGFGADSYLLGLRAAVKLARSQK